MSWITIGRNEVAFCENRLNGTMSMFGPGLHFYNPVIYRIASVRWIFERNERRQVWVAVHGSRIPTGTRNYDPTFKACMSKDGVPVEIDTMIVFQIQEPANAIMHEDPVFDTMVKVRSMMYAAVAQLEIADMTPTAISGLISPDRINPELKALGIAIISISLESVRLPKQIAEATALGVADRRAAKIRLDARDAEVKMEIAMAQAAAERARIEAAQKAAAQESALQLRILMARAAAEERRIRAESEAEAARIKCESEAHALRARLEILGSADAAVLAFMASEAHAQAYAGMGAGDGGRKVIFAPTDVLSAAARLPIGYAVHPRDE
jgi:regulator of protease activity HflC (stomatin/prohibitin superfamily)